MTTTDVRDLLDDALDDLPRYMAVTQPLGGWLPGEGPGPTMMACVYVDDVREMIRRVVASASVLTDDADSDGQRAADGAGPAEPSTTGGVDIAA